MSAVFLTRSLAAQSIDPLQFLPRGASATTLVSDAAGNLYAGGVLDNHGFVAKLPASDSEIRVLYRLTGTGFDSIAAIALAPDGAIFVTGTTNSSDFPATTTVNSRPSESDPQAFVLKLDQDGKLQFATLIGGYSSYGKAVVVNGKGEALVSGQLDDLGSPTFPSTPGAVSRKSDANNGFIIKLDPTGTQFLVAIRGFGLGPVAYDSNENIYVAGASYGTPGISATPGAFQTTHDIQICGGSGLLGIGCSYQYVAKISPDGTKLLYSTFVTGAFGATPSALIVDPAGNALVAGSTNSNDYPVTPGAYQTTYRATSIPTVTQIGPHLKYLPPPSTGYITKLNAEGTGLVWSTFFSGTGAETITSLRLDAQNRIIIAGRSASRDLPGAQSVPAGCNPEILQELPYVAQLSADATTLIASHYIYGFESAAIPRLALRPDGTPVIAAGNGFKPIDLTAATPLACFTDPADNFRIIQAAPGQLITVFGDSFGESGVTLSIDGIAAPLLYASPRQINAQVPFELVGRDVVTLTVQTADGSSMSRPLRIVSRAPSAFLALQDFQPGNPVFSCNGVGFTPAYPPVARNENGSLNSCGNPATPGSIITFYLNGLGVTPSASLQYAQSGTILAFEQDPDSPPGVWRMRVQLPPNAFSGTVEPLIDGVSLREANLGVWIRQ